jgi:hypothetical protein
MPSVEAYENFPWLKEKFEEEKKGCAVKESMTNCLYTTQGVYLCQKQTDVPNKEMAMMGDKGVAKYASPWMHS